MCVKSARTGIIFNMVKERQNQPRFSNGILPGAWSLFCHFKLITVLKASIIISFYKRANQSCLITLHKATELGCGGIEI